MISRARTDSYLDAVLSIGSLHGESINIWSHLLGTIYFLSSARHCFATLQATQSPRDLGSFGFTVATTLCFASSTLYHVFADHIHADFWQHVDHIGILVLMWASSMSFIVSAFTGKAQVRWLYLVVMTAAAGQSLSHLSSIRFSESRHMDRITTHTVFGCVATLPALHVWCQPRLLTGDALLSAFTILVILNGVGGVIYATKLLDEPVGVLVGIPDISHAVMHVAAATAAWVFQQGLLTV